MISIHHTKLQDILYVSLSLILKIEKLIYRPYFKKSIKINKYSIALYKLFLRYCNLLSNVKKYK